MFGEHTHIWPALSLFSVVCSWPTQRCTDPLILAVLGRSGSAGGRLPGQGAGGNGASYHDTPHAKTGDVGSKLLQAWSTAVPITWKAGSVVEVAWALAANRTRAPPSSVSLAADAPGVASTTPLDLCRTCSARDPAIARLCFFPGLSFPASYPYPGQTEEATATACVALARGSTRRACRRHHCSSLVRRVCAGVDRAGGSTFSTAPT